MFFDTLFLAFFTYPLIRMKFIRGKMLLTYFAFFLHFLIFAPKNKGAPKLLSHSRSYDYFPKHLEQQSTPNYRGNPLGLWEAFKQASYLRDIIKSCPYISKN